MTDKEQANTPEVDENRLIAERREKLHALRKQGEAYPNDFRVTADAANLLERFGDAEQWDQAALEARGESYSLAGRILSRRIMGKASFVHIQDGSGARIQLYLRRDDLPEGVYQAFKQWDIGDIVGVTGTLMRTRTGELSLQASDLKLLTKSLRPLPEKWHGLSDQETRYRQRYVDLIVNPQVRDTFVRRSLIIRAIRHYFDEQGFLEVETPMMHHIPGGATARPLSDRVDPEVVEPKQITSDSLRDSCPCTESPADSHRPEDPPSPAPPPPTANKTAGMTGSTISPRVNNGRNMIFNSMVI